MWSSILLSSLSFSLFILLMKLNAKTKSYLLSSLLILSIKMVDIIRILSRFIQLSQVKNLTVPVCHLSVNSIVNKCCHSEWDLDIYCS